MPRKKKDELNIEDFKYVDAFHMNPQTGQRTKWSRIEEDKIEEFAQQYNNYNVFATVQKYRNKVRQEGGGELMYAPLFFDIDSKRSLVTEVKDGKKSNEYGLFEHKVVMTLDLEGLLPDELMAHLHNYNMGIDLPIEACIAINEAVRHSQELQELVWIKNLEMSRQDAVKLTNFFIEKFDMTEDEIRVYFSGSKGFHVLVNPIVLGIKPHKSLHRVFKFIATYLESQLGLKSVDSSSIYGHGRMLRLVNSIHYKSGLFKVELSHDELKGDLRNIINSLAKAPRHDLYPPDTVEYNLNESAYEWYMRQFEAWEEAEKLQSELVMLKDDVLAKMDGYPVCVQFILERGILKAGSRNKATMALASYFKDIGTPMKETTAILLDWVKKIPSSMTSSTPSEIEASTISCVKTVYNDDKYHFGCSFIRSLHSERKGRDYEAVPCAGRACPAHEDYIIDQEPAEFMHLAQTANAQYTGKKVAFNALVSGKMDTPYIVPKKVRYVCSHEPFCDKDCIMHDYAGLYEREFHENERFLIEATGQNDNNMKGILFHHSGASCKKVKSEVLESANVTELLVVPMAERVKTVKGEDGQMKDIDETGNEYVSRKIYAVGEPHEVPKANEYYEIEGYVYAHPRNAMATILTQKHTPLEDSVRKFQLTDEIREQFKVFQVQPGEELDDRVSLIIKDLTENVTLVRERFEPHLAVLMTYHSALNYYFQGQLEKRGWMEVIFVGDSGQAKCIELSSNILTEDGLVQLKDYLPSHTPGDLQPLQKRIYGVNGMENTSHIYINGYGVTKVITSDMGYRIEATPNHPLLVMGEDGYPKWKRTDELKVGDRILIQRGQKVFGKNSLSYDLSRLLGILVGDGCYSNEKGVVDATVGSQEEALFVKSLVESALGITSTITIRRDERSKAWRVMWFGKENRERLTELGLNFVTAEDKEVPKSIRMGTEEAWKGFFRGYFDTDGHWSDRHKQWELSSKSERLIEQVQLMLLNFGIVSKRYSFTVPGYSHVYWGLKVMGKNARLLNELLGYEHSMPLKVNSNKDTIPYMARFVDELWQLYKKDHPEVRSRKPQMPEGYSVNTIRQVRYGKHELTYELLEKLLVLFRDYKYTRAYQVLSEVYERNYYFDTITSIKDSEAFTADFTVPGTHSFFGNGFINHNTQLVNNIMEFAGLGTMTSGEGTSRTGLVYRLEQLGERWFITWGKYPLSDRKLIAIDEFSELHPEDFGKITEARTTGVLRVDRTVNTETNARVRLILLTNPARARTLSSFTHGVESLKTLFASPADIRRLDMAVFLQSGDVPKTILNAEYEKPKTQLITSEALRNSILWAWSRTADQVEITKPAMRKILAKADELAEKYGYAQDIPLLEPSDLRKKLARMSISLASLVHSTDDTHEKIVVKPEHVEYVADFISVVYDNPNARLDIYSAKSKEESELTEEEREEVTKALEDLDFGDNAPVSEEILELFRKNDILKPNEIIDMLGFDRQQVNSRLSILTKHSMIKRTRDGLRKLPKFIEYLNS